MTLATLDSLDAQPRKRLREALALLSLAWMDGLECLCITDHVPVACWGLNTETKAEILALNPRTLSWPPDVVALVIQHELLHRAAYAVAWGLPETDVANLALDITINYILRSASRTSFERFRTVVYARSRGAVLLAAGPRAAVGRRWHKLRNRVWKASSPPNPVGLYYELRELLPERRTRPLLVPFGAAATGNFRPRTSAGAGERGAVFRRDDLPPLRRAAKQEVAAVAKTAAARGWGRTDLPFSTEFVRPSAPRTDDLQQLLRQIKTRKMIRQVADTVLGAERREPAREWVCRQPDRTTQVMMAASLVPDLWPLYTNQVPRHDRPQVRVYVDTSGSLMTERDLAVGIIRAIDEWLPATTYVFADSVAPISTRDLAAGHWPQGGGTNFTGVLEHFTGECHPKAEVALILTDGWGGLDVQQWTRTLHNAGQRLYAAFINVTPGAPLTELAAGWAAVSRKNT
jgi:hypothetical protein